MATAMSAGAAFLVVAGIMALYGLGFILSAVVDLIALALPVWAAELIVAAALLLVAAVAAALGIRRLSAAKLDAPDPQARLKDDVDAVKRAVASGLERGGQQ
jgi:integral membrane protein